MAAPLDPDIYEMHALSAQAAPLYKIYILLAWLLELQGFWRN
jgi:hypothetical protein